MNLQPQTAVVTTLLFFIFTTTHSLSSNHCDPTAQPDPRTLRHDQMTVLINGYSERRIPLLRSIAGAYSASPVVAAVLVLWGNPSTDPKTLSDLAKDLTRRAIGPAPVTLFPQRSRSLNERFVPRAEIETSAVLVCDDDVEVDSESVTFAFRVWANHMDRLVGLFARSHDLDLTRREWIYTVHPDKYSIVLTKFVVMPTRYLYEYTCGGGEAAARARRVVERERNCEDILMNFVAAEAAGKGPVLVGARRARDWGDARNDGGGVTAVGISSRRAGHRRRRGLCIREFHLAFGAMPLRYSYGKVVDSVGEQGLCRKRGKFVFCDRN